jgi:hypothetical protein
MSRSCYVPIPVIEVFIGAENDARIRADVLFNRQHGGNAYDREIDAFSQCKFKKSLDTG